MATEFRWTGYLKNTNIMVETFAISLTELNKGE